MVRTRIAKELPPMPCWRYHPETGEGKIFQSPSLAPADWTRKPLEPEAPSPENIGAILDEGAIIAEMKELHLFIDPRHSTHKLREILNDYRATGSGRVQT